jgi:protein SDA1
MIILYNIRLEFLNVYMLRIVFNLTRDPHTHTFISIRILLLVFRVSTYSPPHTHTHTHMNALRMMTGDSEVAAKKSLEVMIELWRRKVWNDPKTANAVCNACFSKHTKLLSRALSFLCGIPYYDELEEEMEEANRDGEMKEAQMEFAKTVFMSRTGKREREFKRTMTKLKNKGKEKEGEVALSGSYDAISLLYDPQSFAERLFRKISATGGGGSGAKHSVARDLPFALRLQVMNVTSRVIGAHKLVIENFYSYVKSKLQPHAKNVTSILAYCSQASHELVPPELLAPILQTLCLNFVTDRSSPEAMAVGINAVREISVRCPLAMSEDMLHDLVGYRKSKNKSIMMAARSLLSVFRELNPGLLKKKDRGKKAQMQLSANKVVVRNYGETQVRGV